MFLVRVIGLLVAMAITTEAAEVFPHRSELDKLGKPEHRQIQYDDFKEPYLLSVTARQFDLPVDQMTSKTRGFLKQKALAIRGHFSQSGGASLDTKSLPLPEIARTGHQREEIQNCKKDYCGVKLNTESEKGVMEKSPDKLLAYQKLLVERLKAYLKDGSLIGYEKTKSNVPTIKEMIEATGFFPKVYPDCTTFFSGLKLKPTRGCQPSDSFVAEDLVQLSGSDKLKPVLRIGEFFEIPNKNGGSLFFEVIVYNNHFFDTALRMVETASLGKGSAVILTDVVDIDELKKSSVIRFLYRGKMTSAVQEYQVRELDAFPQ